jgi:hypothetical protein
MADGWALVTRARGLHPLVGFIEQQNKCSLASPGDIATPGREAGLTLLFIPNSIKKCLGDEPSTRSHVHQNPGFLRGGGGVQGGVHS